MAASAIPAASDEARSNGRRSRILSCFGPPAVLGSAAAEMKTASTPHGERRRKRPAPRSWWSRFRSKKTVPLGVVMADASPDRSEAEITVAGGGPTPEKEKEKTKKPTRNSLFRRLMKKNLEKDHNIRPNHHLHVQQPEIQSNREGMVRHIASKCRARVEHAPLYRMQDQARTEIRTSHPGSPMADHRAAPARSWHARCDRGSDDPISSLLVLTVILGMLLLGNLICATACMCAWFFLIPQIRRPLPTHDATISSDDVDGRDIEVDVSSEEHKKMVVLQGLLQRDGRRPSRYNISK